MLRRGLRPCCWRSELWSHFSGREFFPARGSWAARSSPPPCERAGIHLQRSADAEFRRSPGDWARGPGKGIELGFLFVRGGISAGGADDDTVAGGEGQTTRVRERLVVDG